MQCRVGSGRVAVATIEAGIQRIRKAAGDRHPVLIWPHYMWAELPLSIGRNQEALAVYRDTVDLCRSIYGDRHRAVGLTKLRMARPLVLTDEVAEAGGARRALEILRYEDGNLANRDNCLDELLNLLHADHRSPDMARLCRQELAGARAIKENKESAAYLISVLRKNGARRRNGWQLGCRLRGPARSDRPQHALQ